MRRWAWLLAPLVLAACQGERALGVAPSGASMPSAGGGPMNGGGPVNAGADASVTSVEMHKRGPSETTLVMPTVDAAVEAGAPADVLASPAPATCDELAAGGAPDDFVGFEWDMQTGTCSGSECWTYVFLNDGLSTVGSNTGCTLSVQRNDGLVSVDLGAADCAAAQGWATNTRFLDVIWNGTGCAGGTTPESFEVRLKQSSPQRKTWGCDEPVLDLVRKCFTDLAYRVDPPVPPG